MRKKVGAMKILMTADTIGGVWQYSLELCRALAPQGMTVALATMGRAASEAQRREATRLANVRLWQSTFKLEWQDEPWDDVAAAGQWLMDLHDQFRPDIIHLNGYAHAALPWRAPVLVAAHSCVLSWWQAVKGEPAPPTWSRYARAVRSGVRAADVIVAPSRAMLDSVRRHYGPIRDGRVIDNARDQRLFHPLAKEPIILSAGRLWDEAKNLAALEAVAPHVAWPVHVAGEGNPGNSQWVHYLGRLDAAAMAHWMGRASIYALPARYEPFGLSALEAALSGCALVLGDIDSLREIWQGAAVFVPPDDHAQLAAVVNRLVDHPSQRAGLSERARHRAMQFSPRRLARNYLSTYRQLLGVPIRGAGKEVQCAW